MKTVRAALVTVLAGAILNLVGTVFPVVGDYWDDQSDAAQIAVIDADRVQFAIAFGLQGLGALIVGVSLFMLGRAIAPIEAQQSEQRKIAALVAGWLGLVVVIGGLSRLLHALFATPEFYVDSDIDSVVVVVAVFGLLLSVVTFGVLAWSAPPPKWAAVVLVVGGLLSVALSEFTYAALIVFAVATLAVTRRGAGSPDVARATADP